MPNDINPHSTDQKTITAMKITPANTETLKPLGDLSILPREIRDEIYQRVFSKTYRAFHSASIIRPASYDKLDLSSLTERKPFTEREPWSGSNLSILRLSKAIKDEAMPLLYSKATFCFYRHFDEYDYGWSYRRPNVDMIDVTNRMTNIELFLDATADPRKDHMWTCHDSVEAPPLQFFRGTSITRKSILIVLTLDQIGSYAIKRIRSGLCRGIRQLTGFETVTLRLLTRTYKYCPPQGTTKATLEELEDAGQWGELYPGHKALPTALSDDLEPTLGKSSTISEFIFREYEPSRTWQRDITFHPKDHQQAAMSVEFERLEKWAVDSHGYC